MSIFDAALPAHSRPTFSVAPAIVVAGCLFFNAVLAIVNGHFTALSSGHVIAAEVVLVAAALGLALWGWRDAMVPYLLTIVLLALFAIVRALYTEEPEPKFLRDAILIPAFAMLGMAFVHRGLVRTVFVLHAVVFAVFLFEAVNPQGYSDLFRIQDFYINTRGNRSDQFYDVHSDLFISATRPKERLFWFLEAPRLSSVFLEPVSLGNYCTIATAFLCAFYRRLGRIATVLLGGSIIAMLIGCDGRLASATSLLILAMAVIAPYLPPQSATLYLPAAIIGTFGVVATFGPSPETDDLLGRLSRGVSLLERYDVAEFSGLSNAYVGEALDSGLAYLITTQSLPGLLLLWGLISLKVQAISVEQIRFLHATCLYVALTMMVSYSFLTIKTAALLWFIHGSLQAAAVGMAMGTDRLSLLARLRQLDSAKTVMRDQIGTGVVR